MSLQVVLKPSELTPLTALALAELARRAGLPAGVFNVVCGDAAVLANTILSSSEVCWACFVWVLLGILGFVRLTLKKLELVLLKSNLYLTDVEGKTCP